MFIRVKGSKEKYLVYATDSVTSSDGVVYFFIFRLGVWQWISSEDCEGCNV